MSFISDQLIEQLLQALRSQYQISPVADGSCLRAVGSFHRSVERRLGQQIRLWTRDTTRLLYLTHIPELDFQSLADCRQLALETGTSKLETIPGHICTDDISLVILCDRAQPDALDALIRSKLPVSHRRALPNSLSFSVAALDLSTGEVVCNRAGRAMKKLFPSAGSQS